MKELEEEINDDQDRESEGLYTSPSEAETINEVSSGGEESSFSPIPLERSSSMTTASSNEEERTRASEPSVVHCGRLETILTRSMNSINLSSPRRVTRSMDGRRKEPDDGHVIHTEGNDRHLTSDDDSGASSTIQAAPKRRKTAGRPCVLHEEADERGGEEEQVQQIAQCWCRGWQSMITIHEGNADPLSINEAEIKELSSGIQLAEGNIESLRKSAQRIDVLIKKSRTFHMIGFFLRSSIAHSLKKKDPNTYRKALIEVLGNKANSNQSAYPLFYEFITHYYVEAAQLQIEHLRMIPLFSANFTWTQWLFYLTKRKISILHRAMDAFKVLMSLPSPLPRSEGDWLQRGWVRIYSHPKYGYGVQATRDICFRYLTRDDRVAANIGDCPEGFDNVYSMTLGRGRRARCLDLSNHWVGKMNHQPEGKCNMKITNGGKVTMVTDNDGIGRDIRAGEELTIDYGIDYWVYQVTGTEYAELVEQAKIRHSKPEDNAVSVKAIKDLCQKMHAEISDYSALLNMNFKGRYPHPRTLFQRDQIEEEIWNYIHRSRTDM